MGIINLLKMVECTTDKAEQADEPPSEPS